jgi:hypothetical protein
MPRPALVLTISTGGSHLCQIEASQVFSVGVMQVNSVAFGANRKYLLPSYLAEILERI